MRRTALLLASMSLAVLLASGAALAEEKVDQVNDGSYPYSYGTFSSNWQYLAQSFTAGKTGTLSKVSVRIAGCSPLLKDINVRLYSYKSTGGYGDPVKSTTLPASQVPCSGSYASPPPWTDISFAPDNRMSLIAGRSYRIGLEPERVYSTGYDYDYYWYSGSQGYFGGDPSYRSLQPERYYWSPYNGADFLFRTYVDVPDSDGDGLANDVDQCRYEAGPASNNGCPLDTVRPAGSLQIDGGVARATTRAVALDLTATDPTPSSGLDSMRLKNAGGSWTAWQPYAASKDWKLTRGAGKKTVYAQYRDAAGNVSAKASDSITYRP